MPGPISFEHIHDLENTYRRSLFHGESRLFMIRKRPSAPPTSSAYGTSSAAAHLYGTPTRLTMSCVNLRDRGFIRISKFQAVSIALLFGVVRDSCRMLESGCLYGSTCFSRVMSQGEVADSKRTGRGGTYRKESPPGSEIRTKRREHTTGLRRAESENVASVRHSFESTR